jgi:hypothetical protein
LNSNFSVVSSSSSIGGSAHGSASSISTRQALQPRWPNETDASTSYGLAHDGVFDPARLPDAPSTKMDKGKGVAGRGNTDPQIPADRDEYHVRSGSASSGDARYYNVNGLTNGRSSAMPSPDMRYASSGTRTPSMDSLRSANGAGTAAASGDVLLNKGLAARARDDLAKAAWYYKQSADAGNSTGRMYWGECFRLVLCITASEEGYDVCGLTQCLATRAEMCYTGVHDASGTETFSVCEGHKTV